MVEEARVGALRQQGCGIRFDWGSTAARLVAGGGALVVVDTLSFTTAVSVATCRGTAVYPWPLADGGAASLAAVRGAALAVPRRLLSATHPWSLSPRSLLDAPFVARLVLPSPNGSALAAAFVAWGEDVPAPRAGKVCERRESAPDVRVLAGCLRNAAATSRWLASRGYGTADRPVTVLAAGERWPDGTMRPAVEDCLGAGAIIEHLRRALSGREDPCSIEARAAAVAFVHLAAGGPGLTPALEACASGRELAEMGFPDEAALAAALDVDDHASLLEGEAFTAV